MAFRRVLSPRNGTFFVEKMFTGATTRAQDEPDASPRLVRRAEPGQASLSEFLWDESQDLAQEALSTKFIQGIRLGDLEPEQYGIYTVQDAGYCYDVVKDYKTLIKRTEDPEVREFLVQREKSYEDYTQELMKQWHIKDADAIELGQAAQEYSDLEKKVAKRYEPLYFMVVSIPCVRLWHWLANQIKSCAVPDNLYQFWIDENSRGSGGKTLQDFVDGHAGSLDKEKALDVYRKAMLGEVNFFRSACEEKLVSVDWNGTKLSQASDQFKSVTILSECDMLRFLSIVLLCVVPFFFRISFLRILFF